MQVLGNAMLGAMGRSNGAYCRKEGVAEIRTNFVFTDCVVSIGSAEVQRCMGERSWGALTEHHGLVLIRDAIDHDAEAVQFKTFEEALNLSVKQKRSNHVGVVLDSGLTPLDLYSAAGSTSLSAHPESNGAAMNKSVHFFLNPPPTARGVFKTVLPAHRVVKCSLPGKQDSKNLVRTIVSLQGHNNCGRLWGVIGDAIAHAGGGGGGSGGGSGGGGGGDGNGDGGGARDVTEASSREDGKAAKPKRERRKKQVQGAFGVGPRRIKPGMPGYGQPAAGEVGAGEVGAGEADEAAEATPDGGGAGKRKAAATSDSGDSSADSEPDTPPRKKEKKSKK